MFVVRTRGQFLYFLLALIRGLCHVFKLLAKDLAGVSERWYNPRTAPSTRRLSLHLNWVSRNIFLSGALALCDSLADSLGCGLCSTHIRLEAELLPQKVPCGRTNRGNVRLDRT